MFDGYRFSWTGGYAVHTSLARWHESSNTSASSQKQAEVRSSEALAHRWGGLALALEVHGVHLTVYVRPQATRLQILAHLLAGCRRVPRGAAIRRTRQAIPQNVLFSIHAAFFHVSSDSWAVQRIGRFVEVGAW